MKRPVEPVTLVEQPFDRDSMYALRATLEAHASQAGLPEGRTADLVLIGHELASNVILYGSGRGWVRLLVVDDMLQCEVIDGDATSAEQETPGWTYEFGHGLWMARCLSDRHAVSRGPDGTVVTAGFALPHPVPTTFELTRDDHDGRTTLTLAGNLDQRTASDVIAAVQALISTTASLRLVLDLSGMTFWDSTGITALVTSQANVAATPGATMVLAGLSTEYKGRLDCLSFVPFTYETAGD
ncbi:STAS domain-containing protein [Nonomuraea guangzhouensis]|uniref:STAS domain-containing protein n=1 Tax=Nonomuraea guangzhouensis TaxID=1291555 RepID=A0ABW4GGF5_9ACTN|nr:STAS domain-containing protein [Nonomuraea guangzhouensis]